MIGPSWVEAGSYRPKRFRYLYPSFWQDWLASRRRGPREVTFAALEKGHMEPDGSVWKLPLVSASIRLGAERVRSQLHHDGLLTREIEAAIDKVKARTR